MMKTKRINLLLLLLILTTSSLSYASFSVPGFVYTVKQLSNAQNFAKNSNKPITFIYSDKNTDYGLATAASKDIFQNLKNISVIVYVERNDWNNLPDIVKNGMNSAESGGFIPKTVIVNSSLNQIICIIPYAATKERKHRINQAQNLISSY